MKFSYLQYSNYKTCPLQYYWKWIQKPDVFITFDKRNAFIGLLLQKVVERFYREDWWKEKDVITRMNSSIPHVSKQIIDADNIVFRDDELLGWLNVAYETIPKIIKVIREEKLLANPSKTPSDENLIEHETEVDLGEDQLQSRPDFIFRRSDVITLLDGKGGKTVGRYCDLDQLLFYCHTVKKLFNRLPHRMGFWWYRHSRIVWEPISTEAVNDLLVRVQTAIRGVKEQKFDPTPGNHCRFCDYRSICEVGQRYINSKHRSAPVDIPDNFAEVEF